MSLHTKKCRVVRWDRRERLRVLVRSALLGLAAIFVLVTSACKPERRPAREVFNEAEEAYRAGAYDEALERYEQFLREAPEHQLAPLAQQRVLNIERELEVIMGRRNGPRPIYLRPVEKGIAVPSQPPINEL